MVLNIRHSVLTGTVAAPTWPDASTTGPSGTLINVPSQATSGSGWAWNAGDLAIYVSGAGITISNLHVTGQIIVNNFLGVTISNCRVTMPSGATYGVYTMGTNTVVTDCEIIAPGGAVGASMNGIANDGPGAPGFTVRRCEISGVTNGIFNSSANALIEDNYIHDLVPEDVFGDPNAPNAPHTDGIQNWDALVDGSIFRHNNVLAPHTMATSAIIFNNASNITVTNNRFRGAYITMRVPNGTTNVYTNNRIGDQSEVPGSALAGTDGRPGIPTWSGNVNDDTGATIPWPG